MGRMNLRVSAKIPALSRVRNAKAALRRTDERDDMTTDQQTDATTGEALPYPCGKCDMAFSTPRKRGGHQRAHGPYSVKGKSAAWLSLQEPQVSLQEAGPVVAAVEASPELLEEVGRLLEMVGRLSSLQVAWEELRVENARLRAMLAKVAMLALADDQEGASL